MTSKILALSDIPSMDEARNPFYVAVEQFMEEYYRLGGNSTLAHVDLFYRWRHGMTYGVAGLLKRYKGLCGRH